MSLAAGTRLGPYEVLAPLGAGGMSWEPPRLAFETDFIDTPGRSYDVTPDGRRLLVVKRAERETPAKIHLLSNWLDVFERRESGASAP